MIKSIKIRLIPTKEQEILMWKTVGTVRYAYNWGLDKQEENHRNGGKFIKCTKLKNEFVSLKKADEYEWLNEISSQAIIQAFENLQIAYDRFFRKLDKQPRFKSRRKSKPSFYARYDRLNFNKETVNLEKIGRVKYKTNYNIPKLDKYIRPCVQYDGKYWYLSLGFEKTENIEALSDFSVGIDLGIKDLAICSHLDEPIKNINKTTRMRKIEKKLKRQQRQCSRKYEMNKQGDKFIKTKNIIKLEKSIKLTYRRLANVRLNHIHQATFMIVKTKPSRVVMEHLNIQGMLKNKHLAKAVKEQMLFEFKRQMKYKCEFNGILFIEADWFYPSSKKCSCCGNVKKDLKLSDRTYKCIECGLIMDRDKNASINLANYQLTV